MGCGPLQTKQTCKNGQFCLRHPTLRLKGSHFRRLSGVNLDSPVRQPVLMP